MKKISFIITFVSLAFFIPKNSNAQTQPSRNVVSSGVSTGGSIQAGSAYLFGTNLYSNGSNSTQIGLGNLCCDAINTPTIVSRNIVDFGLVSEGGYYINQSGEMFGFGSNQNGRFNGEYLNSPTRLESGVLQAAMSAGNYVFLKTDSSAWVNGASTSSSRAKELARNVKQLGAAKTDGSPISAGTEGVLAEIERFGESVPPILVAGWVPGFPVPGSWFLGYWFRADFGGLPVPGIPVDLFIDQTIH